MNKEMNQHHKYLKMSLFYNQLLVLCMLLLKVSESTHVVKYFFVAKKEASVK